MIEAERKWKEKKKYHPPELTPPESTHPRTSSGGGGRLIRTSHKVPESCNKCLYKTLGRSLPIWTIKLNQPRTKESTLWKYKLGNM